MKPRLDIDTLNWLFRLLSAGILCVGLFSVLDWIPFIVRIFGNISIVAGLLFLVDIGASTKFKVLYWPILIIWILVVVQSATLYFVTSEQETKSFLNFLTLSYAFSLLSVVIFSFSMQELCLNLQLAEHEKGWSKVAKFAIGFYILPFLGFFVVGGGRVLGVDMGFVYDFDKASPILAFLSQYGVRALFFLPPTIILIKLNKIRKDFRAVAP